MQAPPRLHLLWLCLIPPAEPQFRFVSNTPHVEGNVLELALELLGCATLTCADEIQPFTEDCKSKVGQFV